LLCAERFWVLPQVLRYAIFNWTQKFRKAVNSDSQSPKTISSSNHTARPPFSNLTVISRRTVPCQERWANVDINR
jgi:hypothetical protein